MTPALLASALLAPNDDAVIHRTAARAILLTPERQTLLLRIKIEGVTPFWIAPGGGVEGTETLHEALRRELWEELSLEVGAIGPLLWRRQHTFTWDGKRYCQNESYFVVETAHFEPRMQDAREALSVDSFRWWPFDQLADATERLTPLSLAQIVVNWLACGAPHATPAVEVLVD